jgi:hypothetical protein
MDKTIRRVTDFEEQQAETYRYKSRASPSTKHGLIELMAASMERSKRQLFPAKTSFATNLPAAESKIFST